MKIATFLTVASCAAALTCAAPALKAGDATTGYDNTKQVIRYDETPSKSWNASVTSGWDSLYMRNGVNMLGGSGSGWTVKQK